MPDTIPEPDPEFDDWSLNFDTQFTLLGVSLGFVAGDVTAVHNAYTYWHAKFLASEGAQAAAVSATMGKDDQRTVSEGVLRSYMGQLQKKPAMTDALRALFEINIRKARTPIPPPTEVPMVLLNFGIAQRMTIHFGTDPGDERHNHLAKGSTQVLIQCAQGATPPVTEAGWGFLTVDTNSPYLHSFPTAVPVTLFYRVAYMNAKGEQGPWSTTATGVISPG